jgi:hypothetical protein
MKAEKAGTPSRAPRERLYFYGNLLTYHYFVSTHFHRQFATVTYHYFGFHLQYLTQLIHVLIKVEAYSTFMSIQY